MACNMAYMPYDACCFTHLNQCLHHCFHVFHCAYWTSQQCQSKIKILRLAGRLMCSCIPSLLSSTLWLFNIAMENGPFIDDFPIKTSIYGWFSMAMSNNQMVETILMLNPCASYPPKRVTTWNYTLGDHGSFSWFGGCIMASIRLYWERWDREKS